MKTTVVSDMTPMTIEATTDRKEPLTKKGTFILGKNTLCNKLETQRTARRHTHIEIS